MFTRVIIVALAAALTAPLLAAAEMSSTNYHIYADTIGVNSGSFSSSTSYSLQDTIGETPGFTTSTTYELRGGYQAMERGELTLSISDMSINLGALSTSEVKTASTIITVRSDASTGYALSISAVGGSMPSPVSDGAVSAGAEEYGFSVSGPNALLSGDNAVSAGTTLAAASQPVASDPVTLTFKASHANNSVANSYSQTIVLTVSANF